MSINTKHTIYLAALTFLSIFTIKAEAQSPGGVEDGLYLWLKGNQGMTNTTNGSLIDLWEDSSGNSRDAVQGNDANKPYYVKRFTRYYPGTRYGSSTKFFETDLDALADGNYTVFVVYERRQASTNEGYMLGIQQTVPTEGFHVGFNDDENIRVGQFGQNTDFTVEAYDASKQTPGILTLSSEAGERTIQRLIDGSIDIQTDTYTDGSIDSGLGVVGRGFGTTGFAGNMGEIIVYDRKLTDAEIIEVESYLSLKYGITVPTDHTNYWSDDTFNNNVSGIIQDDNMGLTNTRAHSVGIDMLVELRNSGNLDDGEMLLIGHNDEPIEFSASPSHCSVTEILKRSWKVSEVGDIGIVDIFIDEDQIPGVNLEELVMIIDKDGDGFDDEEAIEGRSANVGRRFDNINFEDGWVFTFGYAALNYYSRTDGNSADAIWATSPTGTTFVTPNFCRSVNYHIQAGTTVTFEETTLELNELNVESGASLIMPDGVYVEIYEDIDIDGDIEASEATLHFKGEAQQSIRGATPLTIGTIISDNGYRVRILTSAVYLTEQMEFVRGSFRSNNKLHLVSDENGTAMLGQMPASSSFVGRVFANRYHNTAAYGYVMVGSPIQGTDIDDINDDIWTQGFPDSDLPSSWSNIYTYDETTTGDLHQGFEDATSLNQDMEIGQGYMIYMAPDEHMIDFYGKPHIGNVSFDLDYTDTGSPLDDGWNLVCNPYLCTVDWDGPGWFSTGIEDAIYVYDAETGVYTTYIDGVGNNGGSRYIAPFQSFWVRTNNSTHALVSTEAVKELVQSEFRSETNPPILQLSLAPESGNAADQVTFALKSNATEGFDQAYDALKMIGSPSVPLVAAYASDDALLSISSLPTSIEEFSIPLKVSIPSAMAYSFSCSGIEEFGNGRCVTLFDSETGVYYQLYDDETILISLEEGVYDQRFFLTSTPSVIASVESVLCNGMNNGEISLNNTLQGIDVAWYNEDGDEISSMGGNTSSLNGLAPGEYYLLVEGLGECSTLQSSVLITEPAELIVDMEIENVSCNDMMDGEILVFGTGGTLPYTYTWEDNSQSQLRENLAVGEYSIFIEDANGCTVQENISVVSENEIEADFDFVINEDALAENPNTVNFYNTSYGSSDFIWDFGDDNISFEENPVHMYSTPGIYEVTLIASENECSVAVVKNITVSEVVSVNDETLEQDVNVYFNENELMIDLAFSQKRNLMIRVYNVLGQMLTEPITGQFSSEQIKLHTDKSTQHLIVDIIDLDSGQRMSTQVSH